MSSYVRFIAMIATSALVMFGLTYLTTCQLDHIFFSETRAYMALVMGAAMAVVSYMKAMIPHHSIALVTSERARITDPRVRALTDGIIKAQRREIDELKLSILELEAR